MCLAESVKAMGVLYTELFFRRVHVESIATICLRAAQSDDKNVKPSPLEMTKKWMHADESKTRPGELFVSLHTRDSAVR
jgi:hypothetical protein